jgi:hypothetical protein
MDETIKNTTAPKMSRSKLKKNENQNPIILTYYGLGPI